MARRFVLFLAVLAAGAAGPALSANDPVDLTVHEWGTFTSVAGEDGRAVEWLPQTGPEDLPRFVDRAPADLKGWLAGTVRMETPVLYFYAPQETRVRVAVRFRQGVVTEWFPRAVVSPARVAASTLRAPGLQGSITWTDVRVLPRTAPDFPRESAGSHYYAARDTDAAPVRVGSQSERFLFYRGVGRFQPPLRATMEGGRTITVKTTSGEPAGDVMLFDNRRGAVAWQHRRAASAALVFDRRSPNARSDSPRAEMERVLVAHGLYPKEAAAMVETWRDSWFEEGTRLFYVLPRRTVDAILPLQIDPAPAAVARVFVGRIEMITPETLGEVRAALASDDRATLRKHGRFLRPIADRLRTAVR